MMATPPTPRWASAPTCRPRRSAVGSSASEEAGVISGYAALLDPVTIGLGVTAYAHINLERHGEKGTAQFEAAVALMPEVRECFGYRRSRPSCASSPRPRQLRKP